MSYAAQIKIRITLSVALIAAIVYVGVQFASIADNVHQMRMAIEHTSYGEK